MQSTITLPQKVYNSVVLNQSFKLKYTVTMAGERYRPIILKAFPFNIRRRIKTMHRRGSKAKNILLPW